MTLATIALHCASVTLDEFVMFLIDVQVHDMTYQVMCRSANRAGSSVARYGVAWAFCTPTWRTDDVVHIERLLT